MARKTAVIEIYPEHRKKKKPVYRWRKVGANGVRICYSATAYPARRYAAVAARRELRSREKKNAQGTYPLVHISDAVKG